MATKPTKPKTKKAPLPRSMVETLPSSRDVAETMATLERQILALQREARVPLRRGPVSAARAFCVLHRLHERMEAVTKQMNSLFNAAKTFEVPEVFSRADMTTVPLDEGYRVTSTEALHVSIRPGKKEEALEYLKKHDLEDLIQVQVSASTLSATARHMLKEENTDLPPNLFRYEFVPTTSMTATKTAKET